MKFLLAPAVQLAICLGCLLRCSEAYHSAKYAINKSYSLRMMAATMAEKKRVVIVGATGYIGKFVVKESIRRGYDTIAVVREGSAPKDDFFKDATVVVGDVSDETSILNAAFLNKKTDVVISCLASRSGTKSDSYKIDYQATLNTLNAAKKANVGHFVLLSAFCVKKPLLQFQNAKLEFESELIKASEGGDIKYSIVRPTAFFKSVSGQLELLQQGWPFVMFGDGTMCKCNPIAESDLATYMINCIEEPEKWNKIMDIGGPDEGMSMKQQGDLIFEILDKKPAFWAAPISLFDAIIGGLAFFGKFFDGAEDAAELARIGKYYAVEDMLTTNPTEKFGQVTLKQHYTRIAKEGQDYDPYTTMLAPKKQNK